jgi:hypothetical protein
MLAQATRFITLADRMVPWWRTFDGWFWQTDAETDTAGHLPSAAEVKVFSDAVAHQSGKTVVVYASHGMYGNRLAGLGHPLWNANYPTNRQAPFKLLYPGDGYAGWNDYSGQTPALCQYTSSATIAGLSTCDANGFRGTIDQLLELINPGGTDMSAQFTADLLEAFKDPHVAQALRAFPWQYSGGGLPTGVPSALLTLSGTYDNTDAMKTALAAINAKLDGLAQGGGVVDLAAVRAIVRAELDATHLTGAAPEPAAG